LEVANALAYYDTAKITAVNSFIVQALGLTYIGHLGKDWDISIIWTKVSII